MHVICQQLVHGVPVRSWRKPQNFVGNRTQLQADALGLHVLHDVRVLCQGEAVPDALRAQQKSVNQVTIRVGAHVQRLATVKQERNIEFLLGTFLLEVEQFGDVRLDRVAFCLFPDQVKTYSTLSIISRTKI